MQHLLISIVLFIFGACFGSFGSVLLTRLHDGVSWEKLRSILIGYSKCPVCNHRLGIQSLIPMVSFFIQKKQCTYCKEPISWMYTILELLSGCVFVFTYWMIYIYFGDSILPHVQSIHLIFWLVVQWMFVLLIVHDIYHWELHVPVWFIMLCVVLIFPLWLLMGSVVRIFVSSALFGILFYCVWYISQYYIAYRYGTRQEGIGEGDAMFAFVIGGLVPIVLQYHDIGISLYTLAMSFLSFIILASCIGLGYAGIQYSLVRDTLDSKRTLKKIPFIPCMIIALWILLLYAPIFNLLW